MNITIHKYAPDLIAEYAQIPTAFEVNSIYEVEPIEPEPGGLKLVEKPVTQPYIKDYDALPDGGPANWEKLFDLSAWRFIMARDNGRPVGAAALALWSDDVDLFDGCRDFANLWDIRVHPDHRGRGIGEKLFRAVVDTAREMACRKIKIETQNINVPACRFYAAQGCYPGKIDRFAYAFNPTLAHETMLIWYYDL